MPAETNKDTITAYFAGKVEIVVNLYEKSTKTRYWARVAVVYITDESNMTEIKTVDDLVAINNNLSGNYILKANLNLSDIKCQPIKDFTGVFINKGNYIIRNINYSALFSTNSGYIDGLILEDVLIDRVNDSIVVTEGTIASTNEGMIANCSVNGTVLSNMFVGGIAGYNIGLIVNCNFSGIVRNISNRTAEEMLNFPDSPVDAAGGIAGENGGTIINCTASGQISSSLIAGGIVGIDFTAHYRGKGVINSNFVFLPDLHGRLIAPIWGHTIGWVQTLTNRN